MRLTGIRAVRSLDSHGRPAISICAKTDGAEAWSQAQAGKNISFEIESINAASKKLENININKFEDLKKIESVLGFSKSATVAAECAVLKALSAEKRKPLWKILNPNAKKLPQLLVNVAGRQVHGHENFDLNEILISPQTKNISEAAFTAAGIFNEIKKFRFNGMPAETALEIIDKITSRSNCKINLGADIHASALCRNGKYSWKNFSRQQKGLQASEEKQIELAEKLANRFDLAYVEDPLHKNAFNGFRIAKIRLNKYSGRLVAGDCLIASDMGRLATALKQCSINAVVVNPFQAGSLTRVKQIFDIAGKNEIKTVLDVCDETGAHIARAWQASFAKVLPFGTEINEFTQIYNTTC